MFKFFSLIGGGEFRPLLHHFKTIGVHFQHPCPYVHAQNGKVERKHRHIVDIGLTLLAQASLPLRFWWDAFDASVYLINRLPSQTTQGQSPTLLLNCCIMLNPITCFLRFLGVLAFQILNLTTPISLLFDLQSAYS